MRPRDPGARPDPASQQAAARAPPGHTALFVTTLHVVCAGADARRLSADAAECVEGRETHRPGEGRIPVFPAWRPSSTQPDPQRADPTTRLRRLGPSSPVSRMRAPQRRRPLAHLWRSLPDFFSPAGATDNSPAIHRWVGVQQGSVPQGRLEGAAGSALAVAAGSQCLSFLTGKIGMRPQYWQEAGVFGLP